MLRLRILTALLLIPVTVVAVFYLAPAWFAALTALVVLLGFNEWNRLVPFHALHLRIGFVLLGALYLHALWTSHADRDLLRVLSAGASLWWLAVIAWILSPGWQGGRNPLIKFAAAFVSLGPA